MAESVQTPLPHRVRRARLPARVPPSPPDTVHAHRRLPRLEWPACLTVVVVVTALAAVPPIFVSSGLAVSVSLRAPAAYVAAAPLSDVLDALSLLSLRQHVALLATVLLAHIAWRIGKTPAFPPGGRTAGEERWAAARLLGAVVVVYAVGLLTRRPMAALELGDPDRLTVDFHSHTSASHDGRPGFTPHANREWHRAAGFDAGYVSDHRSLAGAMVARASNPAVAGAGTVLLPAIEAVCGGQHVILLDIPLADSLRTRWDCDARPPWGGQASAPLVIFALPGDPAALASLPNLAGAELVDGAPRALDQTVRFDARLRRAASRQELALVANSNNHGWGRTAVAWNVMRVPGWRGMTPAVLDAAIVDALRRHASRAVVIVERRRVARHDSSLATLALTVPALAWLVATTMSGPERLAWIAWIWVCWAVAWAVARISVAVPAFGASRRSAGLLVVEEVDALDPG